MTENHATAPRARLCPDTEHGAVDVSPSSANRFLARQPILNLDRRVIGYELLFRSGWENYFTGSTDSATIQMLDNCVMLGVDNLSQQTLAFINCTREALVDRMVTVLPPATTVLEILETVLPDEDVCLACRELRERGYRLALDDFRSDSPLKVLLPFASYVKVDFRLSNAAERAEIVAMATGTCTQLLAEKIENQDEFDLARLEGFTLFQGYFFCRPSILVERDLPANWSNYMRLIAELNREPMNMAEVAAIVESEASLCYRLLRLANSAAVPTRKEVTSAQGAMILVGEARFRTLATLALTATMGRGQPEVLIQLSLERARFCQRIAPLLGEDPNEQYLLGLMSLIGAMLRSPMERLLQSLPLRDRAKAVLLGAEGKTALPLRLIIALEGGDWTPCVEAAALHNLNETRISSIYLEAIIWAQVQTAQLDL